MNPLATDASQPLQASQPVSPSLSSSPLPSSPPLLSSSPLLSSPPRATARLQLHADFTLLDARRHVPYYAQLGISHLYISPIFPACPGSQHRYDVLDFTIVSPILGGEAALRDLTETLRAHGMGLIIDIVPNHMAASYVHNTWWRDVLAHGRKSRYADFFDIDWQVPDPALCGKLLLPILGQSYGEALKAGELTLAFEPQSCNFELCYFDTRLPLALSTYADILRADPGHRFDTLATRCKTGDDSQAATQAVQEALRSLLRDEAGAASLVQAHDPRTADGLLRLHNLLQRQYYRLAWWRTAADEINWRRFFEISELVGLRVERPEVFEATHALVCRLYREGLIDGVRADHVDGLVDPAAYCRTLRSRLTALTAQRPEGLRDMQPYFVVEKILANDEALRTRWAVDGSTGYDFMNEVSAVLHDAAGATSLDATWCIVSAEPADFATYELAARKQVLSENLCSERDTVVRYLHELARLDMSTQDLTRTMIQRALEALLHYFPVYRTYFRRGAAEPVDNAILQAAVDAARQTLRAADHPTLLRLQAWLGSEQQTDPIAENLRQRALARFQQLSSPLAAKSVEDTAFYRYGRLLSRNEVGSKPDEFALSPQAFHERVAARNRDFPRAMLATATHDHKRGPDARARLAVLSELPHAWRDTVVDWIEQAQRLGPHPDAIDQSMLYQTLIGAWPLDLPAAATATVHEQSAAQAALHTFIERVEAWQLKSLREAKRRSNWIAPDLAYEQACGDFLHALERDFMRTDSLLASVGRFAHRLSTAGALNSLTQTALHLTTPGVPDIYQGSESWDFSMVDPDNRRPVAFDQLLADLQAAASWPEVLLNWQDGRIKQKLVHTLLALRRAHPALFALGSYTPLVCEGPVHAHVIGHARQHEAATLMVIASRLSMSTPGADVAQAARPVPLIAPTLWQDTALIVPTAAPVSSPTSPQQKSGGDWINMLTGEPVAQHAGRIYARDALATLPVAVLMRAQ